MNIWKWIFVGYVGLSFLLDLGVFIVLIREDIRMIREPWRYNQSKFGYNLLPNKGWSMKWGLGWWFLTACLPIINIPVAVIVVIIAIRNGLENWRMTHE
jgi:hypothetical protein